MRVLAIAGDELQSVIDSGVLERRDVSRRQDAEAARDAAKEATPRAGRSRAND